MIDPRVRALVLCALVGAVPALADGGWPGLRGPTFDGAVRDARSVDGPDSALTLAWKRPLGSGYSGVVVGGGRLATMFSDGDADWAAAFDPESGEELWRYRIADRHAGLDGSHDGPISTPWITGDRLFGLGPRGQLFALDAATGAPIWVADLVADHGAKAPYYGFTTSPLLVNDVLVVEIGAGEGKTIAGFDPTDGRRRWSVGNDEVHYHSPIVATLGGVRQVVAVGSKTVLGIDPASGATLWSHDHGGDERAMGGATIVPVPAGESRLFLMNKIDSSVMLRVEAGPAGVYRVSTLWENNAIRSSYVIPVYHDGHLFGMSGRILTCVDAATGETAWRSREPGDGFPTLVGDHLVIVTKPGTLHVAEAAEAGYHELANLPLFDEHTWSAVAYADGHLYARSMAHLARIDAGGQAPPTDSAGSWIASTAFGRFLADLDRTEDKRAAIDAWIARQPSFPIVEESGAVHFVYRGAATDVGIVGDMIGYRREDPMTRVPGTDLFHYSTRLEPDASATYGFIPDFDKTVADPLNPRPGKGLFGEVSWFSMPGRPSPPVYGEADPARRGRLETLEWESAVREGQKRTARVYLPADYDADPDRRYPVVYVHDGGAALEEGGLEALLDQSLGVTIEPLIAVFVLPDAENPRRDLGQTDKYSGMVSSELVPLVDARYRTAKDRMERAAVGAAAGADVALHGALTSPELFGRIGSLWMTTDVETLDAILPNADERPFVIWQGWGTYHMRSPHEAWDLAVENRKLRERLRAKGHRPGGGEVPEGFGWACWGPYVEPMLAALFPVKEPSP